MNKKISIVLVMLILFPTLCWGEQEMKSMCRHKALYAASIAVEQYEVRFAVGRKKGIPHVEAQAKINGEWCFLDIVKENGWTYVRPVDPLYDPKGEGFHVREYWTWVAYLSKWSFVKPKHNYNKVSDRAIPGGITKLSTTDK